MFSQPHLTSDCIHNELINRRFFLPTLCFTCRQIRKVTLCSSYFCSHRCADNHDRSILLPFPIRVLNMDNDNNHQPCKMDSDALYVVHKKKKVYLPEEVQSSKSSSTQEVQSDDDDDSLTEEATKRMDVDVSHTSTSSEKKRAVVDHASTPETKKKGKKCEILYDEIRTGSDGKIVKESIVEPHFAKDNNAPLPHQVIVPPVDHEHELLPGTNPRTRCKHCNMRDVFCHNKRYGRYCILATIRYRRKAKQQYTDELAKAAFIEAYAYASEFERFLSKCSIPTEMKEELPECMVRSSLAIALITNDWNFFIHGLEKAVV